VENKVRTVALETEFEAEMKKADVPFSEYPRAQMKRESYLCLNGKWQFELKNNGKSVFSGEITVPFPPESRISGAMREVGKEDVMIYSRSFALPEGFNKGRVILHFGAVDQRCEIYVNGTRVGENVGGYLPFSFDITDAVTDGENTILVTATDALDMELPYGKQSNKRGGMWYTKTSGIWQTVWLESVPTEYVRSLRMTPSLESVKIEVEGGAKEKKLIVNTEQGEREYSFAGNEFELKIDEPHLWSPDDPYLYEFTLICGEDKLNSYFALRTISVESKNGKSYICLNGKPVFFNGLLDQGYFSDGIFLPATEKGFENDVIMMKKCGFNMLRKHIKLEPELFYYYCDKHGMIVFQDMINSGKYSFFIDTALPTVFLRRGISHRVTKRRREEFLKTSKGIIDNLYNHPCVCYYTIFNEGWGQFEEKKCYELMKKWDGTRVYDTTSGWFKTKWTDVESDHIYFKPVKLKSVKERPMVLSEFGGYSYKVEGHSFNLDKTYGYRFFTEQKAFEDELIKLYENEVASAIDQGLCAAVLTQVSDVEDETNGLLTYDRKVLKVNAERMKTLAKKLEKRFEENLK